MMVREPAKRFEDLIVWKKAHEYVLGIYKLTKTFPREELYALTSQLRRAAVSVPANIVEGFTKKGKADKLRYLNIAQASLEECRYFLILAADLKYCDSTNITLLLDDVGRLLSGYMSAFER